MIEQKLYELRVDGHGATEFRAGRPYGVGDRLRLPLARGGEGSSVWIVVGVEEPARPRLHAALRLAPAS